MESKTKELVKAGHELVVLLGNQHGMIDAASLVQRLTAQLDITAVALREKSKQCDQLAAEALYLRGEIKQHSQSTHFCEVCGKDDPCITDDVCMALDNTPTTDAWQREQRQKAWAEGINYTAGRLAAAFNHGCVNKPMAEVGDVVRMILTTKEDLANDPAPAADGMSGEYAEKALQDWEQQLRNGEAA